MDTDTNGFQFIAGHLALDFVNTVAYRADDERREDRLRSADDVVRWANEAQLADRGAMTSAPRIGAAGLERIRAVREELFAAFHALANGTTIPADALARVSDALNECSAKRRLALDDGAVRWVWRSNARSADYLLFPVLSAATALLTSEALPAIRQCEDAGCGWLFLDRSNARKRRWCSMADCGNRNKARNFYRREARSS